MIISLKALLKSVLYCSLTAQNFVQENKYFDFHSFPPNVGLPATLDQPRNYPLNKNQNKLPFARFLYRHYYTLNNTKKEETYLWQRYW